jgi:hypothetical protein
VVERFADGRATNEEVKTAEAEANAIWLKNASDDTALAFIQLFWTEVNGLHVSTTTLSAAFEQQQRQANKPFESLEGRTSGACPSEEREQCALIRDIFGNPFHPITFTASWRTGTAITLSREMYESRDFAAMPILADALQDAGCNNADILDHCRGPGPHVRGCFVVDLLLDKT